MPSSATTNTDSAVLAERSVKQLRRQLLFTLFYQHALLFGTIWLFTWGASCLVLRVSTSAPSGKLLWGATGLLLALALALWRAQQRRPADSVLRAWLDQQNHCGGKLMAAGEASLGAWDLPALAVPRLRWRSLRAWGLFVIASSFVVGALLLPVGLAGADSAQALDIKREADQLKADLSTLQEAGALAAEKAQSLEQQLQQVQQEASGADPVKTWEALDQLNDKLGQAAREAAQQSAQQQQKLEQAAALAEALQTGANQLDEQTLTEAMQTLSSLTQQALQKEAQALPRELQQALKDGKLNAAQLQQLSQALQQGQGRLNQQLSKLAQSGLIKPGDLKQGATAGKRNQSGLAKHLAENARKVPLEKAVEAWCNGKGGVDRGRADAELTWGEMAKEEGAKFKEKTLSPAAVSDLQNSQLVGMSSAAPAVQTGVAAHGALNNTNAGGGSAYTQTVLPRHKGAVKRYFDRQQK
jgi:hypothetical protein